jgi:hypothetical protein
VLKRDERGDAKIRRAGERVPDGRLEAIDVARGAGDRVEPVSLQDGRQRARHGTDRQCPKHGANAAGGRDGRAGEGNDRRDGDQEEGALTTTERPEPAGIGCDRRDRPEYADGRDNGERPRRHTTSATHRAHTDDRIGHRRERERAGGEVRRDSEGHREEAERAGQRGLDRLKGAENPRDDDDRDGGEDQPKKCNGHANILRTLRLHRAQEGSKHVTSTF